MLSLFNAILAVLGVLCLAYWCSRMLGRQWGMNAGSNNMKVLGQLQVGQDKRILLLRVGEHDYLVGVSQAGIQLLAEVEGDFETEMPPSGQDPVTQLPFQSILEKYLVNHQKKKEGD